MFLHVLLCGLQIVALLSQCGNTFLGVERTELKSYLCTLLTHQYLASEVGGVNAIGLIPLPGSTVDIPCASHCSVLLCGSH